MSSKDYEEKRSFRRLDLEMPVKYALVSSPDEYRQAEGSDLSAGGMALHCKQALKPGTEIKLVIDSDSSNYPALEARAVVQRVVQNEADDYLVSVIFHQVI